MEEYGYLNKNVTLKMKQYLFQKWKKKKLKYRGLGQWMGSNQIIQNEPKGIVLSTTNYYIVVKMNRYTPYLSVVYHYMASHKFP